MSGMDMEIGVTPFGARNMDMGVLAANALAQNCPRTASANKWEILRHCITAKALLGVSGRALTVLSALLSCHKEDILKASDNLVVFPSNKVLCQRAHGIAEATLRRSITQLVAAGLLVRRDSPNGKRYARRGADGDYTRVFGFDLRPLLARAADITLMAEDVQAEQREIADLRERITLARRDIVKNFDMAFAALDTTGVTLKAERLEILYQAFTALPCAPKRGCSATVLAEIAFDLELFLRDLTIELKSHVFSSFMDANPVQTERHKQDSNQTPISESEFSLEKDFEEKSTDPAAQLPDANDAPSISMSLHTILTACPDVVDYGGGQISDWNAFITAARLARGALGISPSAWDDAQKAMGAGGAAITVATILQRHTEISSPGGYLRALSDKAQKGKFTLAPVIQSLLRRQLGEDELR